MNKITILSAVLIILSSFLFPFKSLYDKNTNPATISPETEVCLMCHASLHPGIVEAWKNSRHAKFSTVEANNKSKLEKRVSSLPDDTKLSSTVVGCYECHALNTDKHSDSFEHNGYIINVVVSPNDCAACHKVEKEQYAKNIMSHAYANLMDNKLYLDFKASINSEIKFSEGSFHFNDTNAFTSADACLHCHGTLLKVTGKETRETDFGDLEFPVIAGWPNQGVGRINPDGSKGSCTSCHPRHSFSIETARKPDACAQCHKGPDVPAYKVYQASAHGKVYYSSNEKYNFESVPWVVGKDFGAPTCATCHASLLTDMQDNVVAERTHQFNDRLSSRLFGVPYATAHPINPETHKITNTAGLQLAADLDGTPATAFLINEQEQAARDNKMKQICNKCHSTSWTNNHFERLNNVIETSNKNTHTATKLMIKIWDSGYADNSNLFDENIERQWTDLWLFHSNSIRLSAAMGGGGDYGVFAGGRYQLTNKLYYLKEWLDMQEKLAGKKKKK